MPSYAFCQGISQRVIYAAMPWQPEGLQSQVTMVRGLPEPLQILSLPSTYCYLILGDSISTLSLLSTTKDKNLLEEISIYVLTCVC